MAESDSLPKPVKRRIKALKKLQNEVIQLESQFYEEVHILHCKYATRYSALFDKRREILTGTVEPSNEECDWPSDEEEDTLAGRRNAKRRRETSGNGGSTAQYSKLEASMEEVMPSLDKEATSKNYI